MCHQTRLRATLTLVKRYMVAFSYIYYLSFSIIIIIFLLLHWWLPWQQAGICPPTYPLPSGETALLSGAEAWDLVSLTKPFSHFVVARMNMHLSALWAL